MNTNKVDSERIIAKSPGSKTIVVHSALFQKLVLKKAALTMKWCELNQRPDGAPSTPTFADVITEEINKGNALIVLVSRLVREFPEERERIAKITKEEDSYEYVKGIVEIVGKQSKE
jgi:hypothetical protein